MTDVSSASVTNDMTDEAALEILFSAPQEIRGDAEWEAAYNAQVRRLQRDSAGLPLDMAQAQLIERISSTYIRMKWYETHGGLTPAQLIALGEQYLKYVAQFQKVLLASDEVLRQDLIAKFSGIVVRVADMIPDTTTRQEVRAFIREQFASLGF